MPGGSSSLDGPAVGQPTYTSAGTERARAPAAHSAATSTPRHRQGKGLRRRVPRRAAARAADLEGDRKVFRLPREEERDACATCRSRPRADRRASAVPDEEIPPGNVHTVMASGYGYRTYGELMCERQTLQFVETATAIQACHRELLDGGSVAGLRAALASYAGADLVRRMRHSTRGCKYAALMETERKRHRTVFKTGDLFANEASLNFQFDYFETGPARGPAPGSRSARPA